jgi:hydrogenase/urease accessory protein HupE
MRRFIPSLAGLIAVTAITLGAHPSPFSYLDVRLAPGSIEMDVTVHVFDAAHELGTSETRLFDPPTLAANADRLVALLKERIQLSADGRPLSGAWSGPEPLAERQALRLHVRYTVDGAPGMFAVRALVFPYDPVHQTFVNVYEHGSLRLQAILDKDRREAEYFSGTRQGTLAVIRRFVASGVHHILIGPDHLLFLVGLLLLGGRLRQLVLVVSAFTAAHSITLTLAALNLVSPPASIVEPAIALSIVYVGADNLTVRGGRDLRVWIAFTFGLIHGFGFANVLREMNLPPRALGWSLFSFNVGVEIGQLLVVVVVASLVSVVRNRSEIAGRRLARVGSLIVMAAGAFWFIQRVFFASNS